MVFGQGPLFCVSKQLIRRHPITVYENLINKFSTKELLKFAIKDNRVSEIILKHHEEEIDKATINHENNNIFKEVFNQIGCCCCCYCCCYCCFYYFCFTVINCFLLLYYYCYY